MASSVSRLRKFILQARLALLPTGDAISQTPLLDMLAHNWHLGFVSFGGPTVHFQIFRELFVAKYSWLDDAAYDELFGLCQALSGPGSTKMLYVLNVMHYGFACGVAAFFTWSLPMALAAWGLAMGVGRIGDQLPAPAYALLSGLNAATVGIVALAAVQLSGKAVTDLVTRVLVFLGATAGMLYHALWYFPVLIAAGGIVTVVADLRVLQKGYGVLFGRRNATTPGATSPDEQVSLENLERNPEPGHSIRARASVQGDDMDNTSPANPPNDLNTTPQRRLWSWKIGAIIIAAFLASFTLIMTLRGLYSSRHRAFDLFANLYLAGTIIFGGGPVVIPLLRQYTVDPGWVSPRDFLLGLAIVQAFPGPNFNFAVYLGALAVKNSSVPMPVGAAIAFIAIFLPGMWLATGLLGVWSSIRKIHAVRATLRGIHATAVGLVFTAVYRLFEMGYLDADVSGGGSLGRDPWWVVVVATSFVGGWWWRLSPVGAIAVGAGMGVLWWGVVRA